MTTETVDRPEVADEVVDVAEVRNGQPVVRYSATEAALATLARRYADPKQWDLKTTKGNDAARAARKELVTLRTTLESRRKAFKAPFVELGRLIDAEAKRVTDAIVKIETPIDDAIKADEARREEERRAAAAAEAARKAKLQAGVDGIAAFVRQASAPGMTAARLAKGIEILTGMAFPPDQWQEYTDAAVKAHADALAAIKEAHAGAVEREAEAARLEAQRLENERIAAELAEQRRQQEAQAEALRKQQQAAQEEALRLQAAAAADLSDGVPTPADIQEHNELEAQRIADLTADAPKTRMDLEPPFPPRGATAPQPPAEPDVLTTCEPATLKGGDIAARLGFTLQATFIAETLGIPWRATDKAAKLWAEADFARIKAALIRHIEAA